MNRTGSGFSNDADAIAAGESAARQALNGLGSTAPRLVFAFAAPAYNFAQLVEGIRRVTQGAPLLGCSSAGEFTEASMGHDSVAVLALGGDAMRVTTGVGRGLRADQAGAVKSAMAHFSQAYRTARAEGFTSATVFLMTDGLAGNGEELVELVHQETNSLAQVVGGAAADAAKFVKTEVLFNDRFEDDSLAVASVFTRTPIGLGVQHGLVAATRPQVVTKSKGGLLFEIDGKPAFEAYREFAKSRGITLTDANANQFMMVNELGMVTPDSHKIRAPLAANPDGSLLMATEVPTGMAVCIMEGTSDKLVAATQQAATSAMESLQGAKPAGVIMFDCICRRIFLGEGYKRQVEAITKVVGAVPVVGWETYGEIAMTQNQASGFHNSTSVVAVLPQ